MILLWGIPGERPFEAVRGALGDQRQEVVVFDQRQVADWSIELSVAKDVTGRLISPSGALDLAAITAVYARPYDPAAIPAVEAAGPASHAGDHARFVHETLRMWTELGSAQVINKLSAMASNSSKPYQLRLIQQAGFSVPPTLVTTDPAAAKRFITENKQVIYKSASAVRSIVARVTPEMKETRLNDIRFCPTQFQAYVAGTDARVHVVGEELFACEVSSTATDYRYPGDADVTRKVIELPKDVAERCRAVAKQLGLPVAGIDLRRTKQDWVCFEVNPSPAFTYFDLDGAIAIAIAKLLKGKS
jgi:glutathione synthase/RimK-type ligase-like ATP-grasp enzyme